MALQHPLVRVSLGAAVVLGIALPDAHAQTSREQAVHPLTAATLDSGAAAKPACVTCGVVEAVRVLELRGEPRSGDGQNPPGTRTSYRVTVKMADGSYRTLAQPNPPVVGIGDRVRVADGTVVKEE
jgi:hypothetical protein